jgi:hypothetical protein
MTQTTKASVKRFFDNLQGQKVVFNNTIEEVFSTGHTRRHTRSVQAVINQERIVKRIKSSGVVFDLNGSETTLDLNQEDLVVVGVDENTCTVSYDSTVERDIYIEGVLHTDVKVEKRNRLTYTVA